MGHTKPSYALDTPYPSQPIPSELDTVIGLSEWLSPSEYLRKAIEFVFSYNPGEEVGKWVAGDWRGVSTAASAIEQLAEFMEAYGVYVAAVNDDIQPSWNGRAAEMADYHYQSDALLLDADAQVLRQLSAHLDAIAIEMHECAELMADLMHELEDFLIHMGLKLLAAGITSESLIGALIFGAWALSDAAKAVKRFNAIKDAYDESATVVRGAIAVLPKLLTGDTSSAGFMLPDPHSAPPRLQVPDGDPRLAHH